MIIYRGSLMNHPIVPIYLVNRKDSSTINFSLGYVGKVPPQICVLDSQLYMNISEQLFTLNPNNKTNDNLDCIIMRTILRNGARNELIFYGKPRGLKLLEEIRIIVSQNDSILFKKIYPSLLDYKDNIESYW